MKKNKLDKAYWEHRYINAEVGWNIGFASTPIQAYIDQLTDKTLKILIPGAGNSYEAEYLWHKGFKNVYVLDIAKHPLDNFSKRVSSFPKNQLLNVDFFEFNNQFDLIIEQTFFCALNPELRQAYANKMNTLIRKNGKLVGLLFNFPLSEKGPPFGGNKQEYEFLFTENFKIRTLEESINSIKQRQGKELFFIFEKK